MPVSAGEFPATDQNWSHKSGVFDIFSPAINAGNSQPLTSIAGDTVNNDGANGTISVSGSIVTLTIPVQFTIGWGIPGSPTVFGPFNYTGTIVATASLASAEVVESYVIHGGWTGGGSAVDAGKSLLKEGTTSQEASFANLINTSRGINGIGFGIQDLGDSGSLSALDFEFQVSPKGVFDQGNHPPSGWDAAPAPSAFTVNTGTPDQVVIEWPDNAIQDRWLRITIKANGNTGLAQEEVYYVGHSRGETTGLSGAVYAVAFADITPIRNQVGSTVGSDSILDIDKNGIVNFADINAMRSNVGSQLTNIVVP
jgi:hypothetical protein